MEIWIHRRDLGKALRRSNCLLKDRRSHFASLDHDLTIDDMLGNPQGEKTGYDVVCWMEENNVWPADGVMVHSMNPVGRARMQMVIDKHYQRA